MRFEVINPKAKKDGEPIKFGAVFEADEVPDSLVGKVRELPDEKPAKGKTPITNPAKAGE